MIVRVGLVERGTLGQLREVEGTGLRIVVQEVHVLHLLVESPLSCLNLDFRLLEENATIDSTMPLRINTQGHCKGECREFAFAVGENENFSGFLAS